MNGSPENHLKKGRWSRLDISRESRTGIPEVVLAEGKTREQLQEAVLGLIGASGRALITRLETQPAEALALALPPRARWQYDPAARFASATTPAYRAPPRGGRVALLTAGTSDYPVAREAQLVAEALGCTTRLVLDCGVAGLHRLEEPLQAMAAWGAAVYVVAAGREGALPTLVAGLVDKPVIGLPISTGYGLGGRGEAALYGMLQSCTPLLVVNIDAGFVAGATAARIAAATVEGSHGR